MEAQTVSAVKMEPSTGLAGDQEETPIAKEGEEEIPSTTELAEKLGSDYAEYVDIDTSAEVFIGRQIVVSWC